MTETDIIGHLLDVEHSAAEVLLDAQVEADRRISEAKAAADCEYKNQYEQLVQDLEQKYVSETSNIEDSHQQAMDTYRKDLSHAETDTAAFDDLMNKFLFAK